MNLNINEIPKKSEVYESMLHTFKEIQTLKPDIGNIYNSGMWYNYIKVYGREV